MFALTVIAYMSLTVVILAYVEDMINENKGTDYVQF